VFWILLFIDTLLLSASERIAYIETGGAHILRCPNVVYRGTNDGHFGANLCLLPFGPALPVFTTEPIDIRLIGLRDKPYMVWVLTRINVHVIGLTCFSLFPTPLELGFGGDGNMKEPSACLEARDVEIALRIGQFLLHRSEKGLHMGILEKTTMMGVLLLEECVPALSTHGLHPCPFILPGKVGELTDGFRCHIGFYCEIGVGPY